MLTLGVLGIVWLMFVRLVIYSDWPLLNQVMLFTGLITVFYVFLLPVYQDVWGVTDMRNLKCHK